MLMPFSNLPANDFDNNRRELRIDEIEPLSKKTEQIGNPIDYNSYVLNVVSKKIADDLQPAIIEGSKAMNEVAAHGAQAMKDLNNIVNSAPFELFFGQPKPTQKPDGTIEEPRPPKNPGDTKTLLISGLAFGFSFAVAPTRKVVGGGILIGIGIGFIALLKAVGLIKKGWLDLYPYTVGATFKFAIPAVLSYSLCKKFKVPEYDSWFQKRELTL